MFARAFNLFWAYRGAFWQGVVMTVKLSVITVAMGLVMGSFIAYMKMSRFHIGKIKPLGVIATVYVEVIRGTPLLLQLYFFYFLVPQYFSFLDLSKVQCVLIALIFNSAGYVAEIIRSGIAAVDPGQMEAGRCLGLTSTQTMWKIVMPQAVKNILPALGNELVMMIKETSLASTFFVGELTTQSNVIGGATYSFLPAVIVSGVLYLMLTTILGTFVRMYEKRLRVSD